MTWMPVALALASALLAALGWERTRRRRPSLKALERQLLMARAESKAGAETACMSPDEQRPLEARQAHLPPSSPEPRRWMRAAAGALLSLIARFLLQLSGLPLLLMVSSDANLPPIAAMPATDQDAVLEPSPMDELDLIGRKPADLQQPPSDRQDPAATLTTVPSDAFFDGLQFYKVLTAVGRSAVQTAVDAAVARVATGKRPLPQRRGQDSIAIIRERYPDFICLLPTATHPTSADGLERARRPLGDSLPPRMDLLSALRLSTQATSACRHKPASACATCSAKDDEQPRAPALASPSSSASGAISSNFLRVA